MNLSRIESLWLSEKLWVSVTVGLLLLLKLPTIHSAVDLSITTSGTYTIPAGVTAMEVALWGAGGSGPGFTGDKVVKSGGSGSYVSCRLAITGPTTITVIVGQGGQTSAYGSNTGINAIGGGGKGIAVNNNSPGGGGGRSAIKDRANTAEDWVTAGGGGGGGMATVCKMYLFVVPL